MRLLSVSILKVARRPASIRTLVALLVILAFVYLGVGATARTIPAEERATLAALLSFPDAYTSLAGILATFAGLAGAALAGAVAGSEWTWGTLRVAVARGASRAGYVVATVAALALLALAGWVVLYVAGVALAGLGGALSGIAPGDPLAADVIARLPVLLVAGWWSVVMQVSIGYAASFATRSQVAGLVAVVGLLLAEQFAAVVVPAEVLRLAPITASGSFVAAAGTTGLGGDLVQPFAVTTLYVVAAVAGAALFARHTEVT
jgi:hypothetical protein